MFPACSPGVCAFLCPTTILCLSRTTGPRGWPVAAHGPGSVRTTLMVQPRRSLVPVTLVLTVHNSASELPELLALSDRVLVLHRGRQAALFDKEEATPQRVMEAAMGAA